MKFINENRSTIEYGSLEHFLCLTEEMRNEQNSSSTKKKKRFYREQIQLIDRFVDVLKPNENLQSNERKVKFLTNLSLIVNVVRISSSNCKRALDRFLDAVRLEINRFNLVQFIIDRLESDRFRRWSSINNNSLLDSPNDQPEENRSISDWSNSIGAFGHRRSFSDDVFSISPSFLSSNSTFFILHELHHRWKSFDANSEHRFSSTSTDHRHVNHHRYDLSDQFHLIESNC